MSKSSLLGRPTEEDFGSVYRVVDDSDELSGFAFCVTPTVFVTCAHVVGEATSDDPFFKTAPTDHITLRSLNGIGTLRTRVIGWWPLPSDFQGDENGLADIAILELVGSDEEPPQVQTPAKISRHSPQDRVYVGVGVNVADNLIRPHRAEGLATPYGDVDGWLQLEKTDSYYSGKSYRFAIGFSGTPAFVKGRSTVGGMVSVADHEGVGAFLIPSSAIRLALREVGVEELIEPEGPVIGVPAKRQLFGRDDTIERLTKPLADINAKDGQRLCIHGMGGIGKTALLTHVAMNAAVRHRFQDGIFWVSVGTERKDLDVLSEVASILGVFSSELEADQLIASVSSAIQKKDILFFFDNVWRLEQIQRCLVALEPTTIVVSSRQKSFESHFPDLSIVLEKLDPASALLLAADTLEQEPTDLSNDAREALEQLDGLPIAIVIAASLVRIGASSWTDLKTALAVLDIDFLATEENVLYEQTPALNTIIRLSVESLDSSIEGPKRFSDLGICLDEEGLPVPVLEQFWIDNGLPRHRIKKLLQELTARHLLSIEGSYQDAHVVLHDVVRFWLQANGKKDLPAKHRDISKLLADKTFDSEHLEPGQRYALRALVKHALLGSNDQLAWQKAFDLNWQAKKASHFGKALLASDARAVGEVDPEAEAGVRILDSLNHVWTGEISNLAMQVLLRVDRDEDKNKALSILRNQAEAIDLVAKPMAASLARKPRTQNEQGDFSVRPDGFGDISEIDFISISPDERYILTDTGHLIDQRTRTVEKAMTFWSDLFQPFNDGRRFLVSRKAYRYEADEDSSPFRDRDQRLVASIWSATEGFRKLKLPDDADIIDLDLSSDCRVAALLCRLNRVFLVDIDLNTVLSTTIVEPRIEPTFGRLNAERKEYLLASFANDRLILTRYALIEDRQVVARSPPFVSLELSWGSLTEDLPDYGNSRFHGSYDNFEDFELARSCIYFHIDKHGQRMVFRGYTEAHIFHVESDQIIFDGSSLVYPSDDGGEYAEMAFSNDNRLLVLAADSRNYHKTVVAVDVQDGCRLNTIRVLDTIHFGDAAFLAGGETLVLASGPQVHFHDLTTTDDEAKATEGKKAHSAPRYLGFGDDNTLLFVAQSGAHYILESRLNFQTGQRVDFDDLDHHATREVAIRERSTGRINARNDIFYLDRQGYFWAKPDGEGFRDLFSIPTGEFRSFEVDEKFKFMLFYANNPFDRRGNSSALFHLASGTLLHETPGTGLRVASLGVSSELGAPFYILGYEGGDSRLLSFRHAIDRKITPWPKTFNHRSQIAVRDIALTKVPLGTVLGAAITPDAKRGALLSGYNKLLIFDFNEHSGENVVVWYIPLKKGLEDGHSLTISDDGLVAAAKILPNEILIFDLVNFRIAERILIDRLLPRITLIERTVALSRSGNRLAFADESGDVHAFDLVTPWRL